jgi:DNA-directed RNA polymerase specialized sigma24 family protein
MPSRARYPGSDEFPGLATIDERSWAIFVAYSQKDLTIGEIARTHRLSLQQVRRIVHQVEIEIERSNPPEAGLLEVISPVEALGLPVRTRNALRGIGCNTIQDVLNLDLSGSVRGLGPKSKEQLLARLELAGFHHPALEEQPASEIKILERSLERMQSRIDRALGAVAKEIRLLKQRLRKRMPESGRGVEGQTR